MYEPICTVCVGVKVLVFVGVVVGVGVFVPVGVGVGGIQPSTSQFSIGFSTYGPSIPEMNGSNGLTLL
jgi:hypothetical protein